MGACCSSSNGERDEGYLPKERRYSERDRGEGHHRGRQQNNLKNNAADSHNVETNVMFDGSSRFVSMFTQQGRKGVNQDAMTVWENFNGEKDTFFCAVFDGHGPSGHLVAQQVRDLLPPRLCSTYKKVIANQSNGGFGGGGGGSNLILRSLKASLIKSFQEVDQDLCENPSIDTYFSGTTSVTIIKQREHLVIANLGDSRAVLCTRGDTNQLVPVQLTVDLKPNLPSEAERIKNCQGRVFAMEEEPQVYRMWMPHEDCPGLAMARAFGDFCLKDFGLISTPELYYRKLTDKDEFVVMATDGVWDVLSNYEVINIVASSRKRSLAARQLVDHAVRAWRHKYPGSKVDDCAVICLFLQNRPLLTKCTSDASGLTVSLTEIPEGPQDPKIVNTDDGLDTVVNCEVNEKPPPTVPRSFSHGLSRRKRK